MEKVLAAFCGMIQERVIADLKLELRKVKSSIRLHQQTIIEMKREIKQLERKVDGTQVDDKILKSRHKTRFRISGEDLAGIREQFKLSQTLFALLLGVNRTCVSRWEHGKVRISQRMQSRIAPFRAMSKRELSIRLQKVEAEIED